MKIFTGVLFDLDGTLADSLDVWDRLGRDWLEAQGIKARPDLEAALAELTTAEAARYILREYGLENRLNVESVMEQWNAMILEKYRSTIRPREDVAALARSLKVQGCRLGLATSCFPAACEAFLQHWNLRSLFSVIVYSEAYPGGKTTPGFWLNAARQLKVPPKDCVVFEDSGFVLEAVHSAGMKLAAVYDRHCPDWEDFKRRADFSIG
jgi:HAD superfamily hydrolase (TIGR01509 family)